MGIPEGASRETSIRRSAEGHWYHDGAPIKHAGIARAFDAWVDRAEDGRYILKNEVNWAYVQIEGAPVRVERLRADDDAIVLELSDDRTEALRPETLRQDRDGYLYCDVRDGRLTAQFSRHAMFDLAPLLEEENDRIFLRIGTERIDPPIEAEPIH